MRLIPRKAAPEQHRAGESGSAMIIAITVITMCTILSVAVVARTSNGLSSATQNQSYAGALANADAGVSDALFRIDQQGSGVPSGFCVGSGCTVAAVPGAPGVEYRVDVIDNSTVRVRSRGVEDDVPRAVEVELVRSLEFPFAIFAKSSAAFRGNVDASGCTQAAMPCAGVYYVDASEPPNHVPAQSAAVGTTGTVRCTGNGSAADEFVTFPGGTNNGCPNHTQITGEYDPQDPVAGPCPPPDATPPTPCLGAAGTYTALSASQCANQSGTLVSGRYLCTSDLVFTGDTSLPVGGSVEFFVLPPSGGTADVKIDRVSVNLMGDPIKLRINLAGAGKLDGGSGSNAGKINAIVYAPSATSTNNGCKIDIRGALVVNEYNCNGATHLQVQYDTRISTLQQANWEIRNFREIPSREVVIP